MSEAGHSEAESATPAPDSDDGELQGTYLVFRAGETEFAVSALAVEGLLADDLPRTLVPGAAPHIRGVINYRSAAVAVLDLLDFLGLPPSSEDTSRLVIARAAGTGAAIPVQAVAGIQTFSLAGLQIGDADGIHYTRGRLDREGQPLYVLDLPRLFQAAAARAP